MPKKEFKNPFESVKKLFAKKMFPPRAAKLPSRNTRRSRPPM